MRPGERLALAVILGLAGSLITLLVALKAAKSVFWGKPSAAVSAAAVKEAPATMTVVMVILALLCLGIGLYPKAVYRPLNAASAVVQTVTSGQPALEAPCPGALPVEAGTPSAAPPDTSTHVLPRR